MHGDEKSIIEELKSKGKDITVESVNIDKADNGFILRVHYEENTPQKSMSGWGNVERVYKKDEVEQALADATSAIRFKLGI